MLYPSPLLRRTRAVTGRGEQREPRSGGLRSYATAWLSRKRFDLSGRLQLAGSLPCGAKFLLVQRRLFGHQTECASGQATTEDGEGIDVDQDLVVTVLGVKVWRGL